MLVLLIMPLLLHVNAGLKINATDSDSTDELSEDYDYHDEEMTDNPNSHGHGRIVDTPYIAVLYRNISSFYCTGTILTQEWVLTAANCIGLLEGKRRNLYVVAGAEFGNDALHHEAHVQWRIARERLNHPEYKYFQKSEFGVGLLRVDPFVFNSHVNKIGIRIEQGAKQRESSSHHGVLRCTTGGWGHVNDEERGYYSLRTTSVEARHGRVACPCYGWFRHSHFCASAKTDGSLCYSYQGGPLVCDGRLAGVGFEYHRNETCASFPKYEGDPCTWPVTEFTWIPVCPMLSFLTEHVPGLPKNCTSSAGIILSGSPLLMATIGLFSQN